MAYTREELKNKIEELWLSKNFDELYKQKYINYKGELKCGESYQEFFAEYIYNKLIDNRMIYISLCDVENYTKRPRSKKEGKGEEGVQRDYYRGLRSMPKGYDLGKCIWFELPAGRNGCGKGVDLVYFNKNKGQVSIIELKYKSKESLLRPILEIQTYYQRINWSKAIDDLKASEYIIYNGKISIKKYIMFDENSKYMYDKYQEIKDDKDSYLHKLLQTFEIGVMVGIEEI